MTATSRLELEPIKGVLQLYCRALSGTPIEVLDTQSLTQQNIGWVAEDAAATDGAKVYLPAAVERYAEAQDNFAWFKVVATHQVAHVEFGSFQFAFETPSTLFIDRRLQRERGLALMLASQGDADGLSPMQAYTHIGRFLRLFANRRLAFDLFTILEDCRLDYRITVEYPGIRGAASRVQAESLASRPDIASLPAQEALVELLIHMSLEQFTDLPVPRRYAEAAMMLARLAHTLRTPHATVEDVAEASLRAYEIISRLPNDALPDDEWQALDLSAPGPFAEDAYEALINELRDAFGVEDESYETPAPVDYRGDFKPEMVQIMAQLQMEADESGEVQSLTQEMLEQVLEQSVELPPDSGQDEIDVNALAQALMPDSGVAASQTSPDPNNTAPQPEGSWGSPLEPRGPDTYVYDEWDFYAAAYKPRWCLVKEELMEEGEPAFTTRPCRPTAPC